MILAKNTVSALTFIAVGAIFLYISTVEYPLGTAARMGPGYFPMLCSIGLIAMGTLSLVVRDPAEEAISRIHLKPILYVAGALALFALLIEWMGMAVTMTLTVFVVSLARSDMTLFERLALSLCVTAGCAFLFNYLLTVPVPLLPRF